MKKFYCRSAILFLLGGLLPFTTNTYAQTGPGGVGNSTTNKVWLDAGKLTGLSNGSKVSQWSDVSGNGWHAKQFGATNQPSYRTNALNSKPVIRFDRTTAWQFFEITTPGIGVAMSNSSTVFAVAKANTGAAGSAPGAQNHQAIWCVVGNHSGIMFQGYPATTNILITQWYGGAFPAAPAPTSTLGQYAPVQQGQWQLATQVNKETAGGSTLSAFANGNSYYNASVAAQMTTYNQNLVRIGLGSSTSNYSWALNGDIAEMIAYNTNLNEAQRIIVENYLAAKYGLTIANRYYTSNPYHQDVQGIGTTDGTTKHSEAGNGKGLLLEEANNSLNAANEFLFAGHNTETNSLITTNLPAGVTGRWQRDWYLQKTGTIDASLAFDWSEAGLTAPTDLEAKAATYRLLYRADLQSPFRMVTVNNAIVTGRLENEDQLRFTVPSADLTSGYYTLGKLGDFVWTGNVSSDWNTAANWSSNSVPIASSQVVVNTCSVCPVLPASVAVGSIHVNGGKLDLVSHTLQVSGNTRLENAAITANNGSLESQDFTEVYSSNFTGSVILKKTGGIDNTWKGGNRYNSRVKIFNTSTKNISMATQADDMVNQ